MSGLQKVQIGSEAHPAYCLMGSGGLLSELILPERGAASPVIIKYLFSYICILLSGFPSFFYVLSCPCVY